MPTPDAPAIPPEYICPVCGKLGIVSQDYFRFTRDQIIPTLREVSCPEHGIIPPPAPTPTPAIPPPSDEDRARDLTADYAVCEAATPGPWFDTSTSEEVGPIRSISEEDHAYTEICHDPEGDDRESDRIFIVTAREALPAALRLLAEARERIAELEAVALRK